MARGLHGIAWLVLLAWLASSPACDSSKRAARRDAREGEHLVLVGEGREVPTWPILQAQAARFQKLYPSIRVDVIGPEKASPSEQQRVMSGLLKKDADAICVVPVDSSSLRTVIDKLVNSGRPVITIGRDVSGCRRNVYCGPSEVGLGKAAATACSMALQGRLRTVMLLHRGQAGGAAQGRYFGFKEELPVYGNIRILGEADCEGSPILAERLVRARVRAYPRVGCWVFLEDWPLRAIRPEERLLPIGCAMVLCNGYPRHFDRMRRGEVTVIVAFDFFRAVGDALSAASSLAEARGSEPTAFIGTPPEIITPRNLDRYERRWESWKRGYPTPDAPPW